MRSIFNLFVFKTEMQHRKLHIHAITQSASQHTCATKTLVITVFSVNSKRFGFNVASGAQCDILINSAIQILLKPVHTVAEK